MQIGIANGIPLNATVTGDDLIPAYDQASGTEGYVNLSNAVQNAFKGSGAGTANGVLYLDGNRTATSGSALTFDGNSFGVRTSTSAYIESAGNSNSSASAAVYGQGADSFCYVYNRANAGIIFGTNNAERMRLDANGNLLAGTTIADGKLTVIAGGSYGASWSVTAVAGTYYLHNFKAGATQVGSITSTGTSTSYNTSSDYRLKDNQAPLTGSGAFIDALKPKTWNWKADGSKGVGFIAHEVQEVSPTSVVGEKDATRVEQYEVSPAVPATYDEQGNELTPAVEAVMGEREVPAYQAMEYGSAEFIANIVAELQSLRKRVAVLEAR